MTPYRGGASMADIRRLRLDRTAYYQRNTLMRLAALAARQRLFFMGG